MHRLSFLHGLSILTGVGLTLVATPASADVEIANLVVIDHSTFDASGFDPEPAEGQLDSDDWSVRLADGNVLDFGGTAGGAGSDYARGLSPGGADEPGIYAYDVDGAGLIALGIQPADVTFTPGQIVLRLVNNTGAEITEFQVEYTVWVNNDVGRSNALGLAQSADDMTYTPVGEPVTSPLAADKDGFVGTDAVHVVTPEAPIADGAQFYIAWVGDDAGGSGPARDEFAIEGITIRLLNVCGNGLMEDKEECDDGLANADTAACTSACVAAACGDGFVQEGVEECDDGNTDVGDGCDAACVVEPDGTSSGTDGDTEADTTASESGSASDTADTSGSASDSATGASATGASATGATAGTDTDDGESEGGTGEDEETTGCSCNSSSGGAPVWGMLGLLGFVATRRRRR